MTEIQSMKAKLLLSRFQCSGRKRDFFSAAWFEESWGLDAFEVYLQELDLQEFMPKNMIPGLYVYDATFTLESSEHDFHGLNNFSPPTSKTTVDRYTLEGNWRVFDADEDYHHFYGNNDCSFGPTLMNVLHDLTVTLGQFGFSNQQIATFLSGGFSSVKEMQNIDKKLKSVMRLSPGHVCQDSKRLDQIQRQTQGYGRGWLLRYSSSGKGLRLHETSQEGATQLVRDAIDKFFTLPKLKSELVPCPMCKGLTIMWISETNAMDCTYCKGKGVVKNDNL